MIVLILILVLNNEEAENSALPLCPADHIVVSLSYSKYTLNWRLIDFNMCSRQVWKLGDERQVQISSCVVAQKTKGTLLGLFYEAPTCSQGSILMT